MDYIEFEQDLIAILLVVESVNDKNKLLYKYEKAKPSEKKSNIHTFHSPYSIVIAKDFDPQSQQNDDSARRTFRNFDETTLSILTSPNAYGIDVEVQVDDVVFVGHTIGLENNANLKSFAIFFALRATVCASIITSYQEVSKRIGTAIRCEEQRTSYLNNEYAKLMSLVQQHDVEPTDPLGRVQNDEEKTKEREEKDRHKEELYTKMAQNSVLADTLKKIYISLQNTGEISIVINNWLNVSCCLPHRSISISCPLSIDEAIKVLSHSEQYFKPYYGILLVIDSATLLSSLPSDSSSTLSTLVKHLRSTYSMSRLSIETGLPLTQIYRLASHLLYWGRVKIIYPIQDDNVYIISPDADISKQGAISKLYKETFQNTSNYPTLQEALAEYSDAVTMFDHLPNQHDTEQFRERLECVEWLLRHRLLTQVHYYYYILLPNDDRNDFKDEYKKTRLTASRNAFNRVVSESMKSSSPAPSQYSLSSTQNSKVTDVLRNGLGSIHDEVFIPSSVTNGQSRYGVDRTTLNYFHLIESSLPHEKTEYQERLAHAIQDFKEQTVIDFLKIHKYLDGTFHLEEIANSENMTRLQVSMIIEKFRTFVVRALHPDPNPVLQI